MFVRKIGLQFWIRYFLLDFFRIRIVTDSLHESGIMAVFSILLKKEIIKGPLGVYNFFIPRAAGRPGGTHPGFNGSITNSQD